MADRPKCSSAKAWVRNMTHKDIEESWQAVVNLMACFINQPAVAAEAINVLERDIRKYINKGYWTARWALEFERQPAVPYTAEQLAPWLHDKEKWKQLRADHHKYREWVKWKAERVGQ